MRDDLQICVASVFCKVFRGTKLGQIFGLTQDIFVELFLLERCGKSVMNPEFRGFKRFTQDTKLGGPSSSQLPTIARILVNTLETVHS